MTRLIERLSAGSAVAATALARRQGATAGAVHFGPGAFHRAHQAWYFDELLAHDKRFGLCGVSLKTAGLRDALAPQDNLYVLAELEAEKKLSVIGSILDLKVAAEDVEAVLRQMTSPDTRWISSTVTEKGYCLGGDGALDFSQPDIAHDRANPRSPVSFIGFLVEGLRRQRAEKTPPPVIVSCDNLADNGRLLGAAVTTLAREQDQDLAAWIDGEVRFPCTMVDSITPATDDALGSLVRDELGVTDAWPIQRERFCQWVIEDILPPGSPDLASVGVTLTSDVRGYETAKLRLLNGAHSSLAYIGLLKGHETVAGAMADPDLSAFVEGMMRQEIAPLVVCPPGFDIDAYITDVLARFKNPAIRHLLSQIAWDGSKKLPYRLLDTISDALAAGRPTDRLVFAIAAWMAFVVRQAKAGADIVDPLAGRFADLADQFNGEAANDVGRLLALREIFPAGVAGHADFRNALEAAYASFRR